MKLRHHVFVLEYLIDLDGKAAAIRAGYKPRCARAQASRLLRRPDIAAALHREMILLAQRTGITVQRVLEEYARIAFADMRLVADWGPGGYVAKPASELSDEAAAMIARIAEITLADGAEQVELELFDKRHALESLARIFGLNIVEPTLDAPHA